MATGVVVVVVAVVAKRLREQTVTAASLGLYSAPWDGGGEMGWG